MAKFILGKKLGCTQVFNDKGEVVPVTLVGAGDNIILQVKTVEKDGYFSIQVGSGSKNPKNINKPQKGHFKGLGNFTHIKELRLGDVSEQAVGSKLEISAFVPGDRVNVSAKSIGRGFQGVVKRHGFSGGPASHGHRDVLRKPGAIGGRFPQRVVKGKRMAGRMGYERVTIKNLEVIRVDSEKGILALRGSVPGKNGTAVEVKKA